MAKLYRPANLIYQANSHLSEYDGLAHLRENNPILSVPTSKG